jgi:predicted ester cyclase
MDWGSDRVIGPICPAGRRLFGVCGNAAPCCERSGRERCGLPFEACRVACETGKGWEGCKAYCKPDVTFSAQAEPLADVRTLQAYADWMQATVKMLPDARYELKSFATDDERANVTAYAVFSGTHTGEGGPPPTGKRTSSDYVYSMDFDGDKIRHMTKIWNAGWAMKELGWA